MEDMKCLIIYYSQTGNTEKVAKAIQKGVKQAAGNCDIARIKEVNPRSLYEYDLVGIGCPVIGFRETLNVMAFIKDIRFMGGKHAFVFDTHATRGEFFFPSIVPKLRRKGMIVAGMFDCYGGMGQNPTAGHPDDIDLKEAEEFGKEVVERSRRIYAGETDLIPGYPFYAEFNVKKYVRERQAKEREMGVPPDTVVRAMKVEYHPEKCLFPKCRVCMINCPMDGIDITVKPPIVARPCMRCMECIKNCPSGAMTMAKLAGGQQPLSMPEELRKEVFKEFYLKPLAKAEAEGRFRRLIPWEE